MAENLTTPAEAVSPLRSQPWLPQAGQGDIPFVVPGLSSALGGLSLYYVGSRPSWAMGRGGHGATVQAYGRGAAPVGEPWSHATWGWWRCAVHGC